VRAVSGLVMSRQQIAEDIRHQATGSAPTESIQHTACDMCTSDNAQQLGSTHYTRGSKVCPEFANKSSKVELLLSEVCFVSFAVAGVVACSALLQPVASLLTATQPCPVPTQPYRQSAELVINVSLSLSHTVSETQSVLFGSFTS